MTIRTLIVEDEPYARKRNQRLLREEPGFECIGESGDGIEACESILNLQPDLILLDVQIPGRDGFDVLRSIAPDKHPLIIFITAFDEFALKAFEVHAVDYLLKPFEEARFREALCRARERLERRQRADYSPLAAYVGKHRPDIHPSNRPLSIKSDGRVHFVPPDEVLYVLSEGNYVRVVTRTESWLVREPLSSFQTSLPSESFARIHRSTVVNVREIKSLEPQFHGDCVLFLKTGAKLNLSRVFRPNLERILGAGF